MKNLYQLQKIDNLASVYAGLLGLVEAEDVHDQINVFVGFDNEEIGSATKQGADSNYLLNTLERIVCELGYGRGEFLQMLNCSFLSVGRWCTRCASGTHE